MLTRHEVFNSVGLLLLMRFCKLANSETHQEQTDCSLRNFNGGSQQHTKQWHPCECAGSTLCAATTHLEEVAELLPPRVLQMMIPLQAVKHILHGIQNC